ncbi:uncharacterized protein B0H18DRAFT_1004560 [Fomitopsis serialis]|uniref:uncharacterized protein n=1 Tax=Fomitopsis serialis TaxID=139415 RepID=UPI0020082560|nr:uncharacterized protein B0H18DRAFT_1004560 [Neoantrodia serialis]KAH9926933.1 hypothetical protein B0H18DRAFT_1004560 [Neoantrodia serialis]
MAHEEHTLTNDPVDNGTIAPIALVPDDILHQIFFYLPISHVCRYWRQFSLASPRMHKLEAYVERSRDMPLYVKYTGSANNPKPDPSWGRKGVILVDQTYRFAELHVAELRREDITALLTFRNPAPLLRNLSLHAPMQVLGLSLFSRELPSLRDIELSGVLLAWLPYRNMDTMVLHNQLVPSLGSLLTALKDCPKLKVLKLGLLGAMENAAVMGCMTDAGDPQPEVVHLPYLQELTLSSMVPVDIASILHHLVFPKTTALDLKFYGHHNLPLDLSTQCPKHHTRLIGALEWSTHIVLRSVDNKLRIEWEWHEAGGLPEILDTAGFAAITFPILNHLTLIANSFRLLETQWRQIFACVPTVTTMELNIRDSMVLELFNALSRVADTEGVDHDTSLCICPKLTHLKFSRLDEQLTILRGMAEAVEGRSARGARLHAIEIISRTGKQFPREIKTRLRKCVGSVDIKHDGLSMDFGSLSAQLYD